MDFLYILLGFAALLVGGDFLVRGAVAVARRMRISPLVIGLTLVGFGTSTPELLTSVQAALAGSPGIAVGNVVGSNIANILLILGVAALLAPIAVARAGFRRDGSVLLATTVLCVGLVLWGTLGRGAGGVLMVGLVSYLIYAMKSGDLDESEIPDTAMATGPALLLALGGLALTLVGARFLVTGAVSIAAALGVSEAIIGLTVVAVGTSLPELVTSIVAARKGQGDLAFGNVVGSNIFNIFGILGATALIKPLAVPSEIIGFDIWVMLAATLLLIALTMTGWRIGRGKGAILLGAYLAYLAALLVMA